MVIGGQIADRLFVYCAVYGLGGLQQCLKVSSGGPREGLEREAWSPTGENFKRSLRITIE